MEFNSSYLSFICNRNNYGMYNYPSMAMKIHVINHNWIFE